MYSYTCITETCLFQLLFLIKLNQLKWIIHFHDIDKVNKDIAVLFLFYHFTALHTSKGDISASAIYYLWMFIYCYLGRSS